MLRPAIQADLLAFGIKFESKLRGNYHLFAERSKRFAHEFFIRERTVPFGSIEERDASFAGCPNQRDHLLLFFRRTVAKTHSHAAQPDGRNFQISLSKFPFLHPVLRPAYAVIPQT